MGTRNYWLLSKLITTCKWILLKYLPSSRICFSVIFQSDNFPFGRLKAPNIRSIVLWKEIVPDAILIAIVSYAITISVGRLFAQKHQYYIDSNQVRL